MWINTKYTNIQIYANDTNKYEYAAAQFVYWYLISLSTPPAAHLLCSLFFSSDY